MGSLVDEMLLGTNESLEKFMAENPQLYSTRGATKGLLKSEYQRANQMVDRAKQDEKFMRYLDGEDVCSDCILNEYQTVAQEEE